MDDAEAREVVRGLREGSPDAWRKLYDAFAERVWCGVARRLGPHPADVADVVQNTMLAAARSARSFDESRGTLWLWLWGIARVQMALHYRKQQRHDRLRPHGEWFRAHRGWLGQWFDAPSVAPPDRLEAAELATIVRQTLTDLPGDYESLLTAKYLDGESIEQIAGREQSTASAIRSKLARAREAFRHAFTGNPGGRQTDPEASHAQS